MKDKRNIIVTGANSGLGFETAQALLEKGASVILACRSLEKAKQAYQKLIGKTDYITHPYTI